MKGIDLELEELLLLRRQSCDPFCLVKFERGWVRCRRGSSCSLWCSGCLWGSEEGHDITILLGFFWISTGLRSGLAFEGGHSGGREEPWSGDVVGAAMVESRKCQRTSFDDGITHFRWKKTKQKKKETRRREESGDVEVELEELWKKTLLLFVVEKKTESRNLGEKT